MDFHFNFAGNLIMLPILFKFGLFLRVKYLCNVVTWSSPPSSPVSRAEVNKCARRLFDPAYSLGLDLI